jgi:Na+/H+ antiporter NhaD/arsenite permease-like protein
VAVFAVVLAGFTTTRFTGLQPATIALTGAAGLMLLENLTHHRVQQDANVSAAYGGIDLVTIFFFTGLFIVVHGVQSTGLMDRLAHALISSSHGRIAVTISIVLWSSAILSAFVDNIPFVAAMIPLVKAMAPELGGDDAILPIWVALSLGACLGGNGTLIGASANLTVAGIAQREGVKFGFATYTGHALPLTAIGILISQVYLALRYF